MALSETPPADSPTRPRVRGSFIARYWRGEVALGRSFWLVYLLLSFILGATFLALIILFFVGTSYDPRLLFLVDAGLLVAALPISTWQFVGVWRSAEARRASRRREGKSSFWSYVAQGVAAVVSLRLAWVLVTSVWPQVQETYRMAVLGDPGEPDYGFRVMRGGTEIEIVGGFKFGLTRDFEALVADKPQLRVVHLDSGGGRAGEARHLYETIRRLGIDTYVTEGCYSACTIAFAAGKRRWLAPDGKLGFHAPAFPGLASAGMVSLERDVFEAAGFAPKFIAHAVSIVPPTVWIPTRQELVDAHVVTDLATYDTFADSGAGLNLTKERWEAGIGKVFSNLGALATSRPDLFEPIVTASFKAYQDGASEQAIVRIVTDGESKAYLELLPEAEDAVLVDYAKLVVDQYARLLGKSPELCHLYHSRRSPEHDFADDLGPDLIRRESAIKTKVLAAHKPRDRLSETEVAAVQARFRRSLGAADKAGDLPVLDKTPVTSAEQAAYCRAVIATYRAAAEMDAKSAGSVLSTMVGRRE